MQSVTRGEETPARAFGESVALSHTLVVVSGDADLDGDGELGGCAPAAERAGQRGWTVFHLPVRSR